MGPSSALVARVPRPASTSRPRTWWPAVLLHEPCCSASQPFTFSTPATDSARWLLSAERALFLPPNFDSVTAANNEEVFLKGLSATTLEIPQDGNQGGASAMSVNLQHEDATTATTNFAIIWFSAPHGLTVADHGLNFALTY